MRDRRSLLGWSREVASLKAAPMHSHAGKTPIDFFAPYRVTLANGVGLPLMLNQTLEEYPAHYARYG